MIDSVRAGCESAETACPGMGRRHGITVWRQRTCLSRRLTTHLHLVLFVLNRTRRAALVGLAAAAAIGTAAALSLKGSAPVAPPPLDVTTSSFVAYRFYEEGMRSYAGGDYREALRLFEAALSEDSVFAMPGR